MTHTPGPWTAKEGKRGEFLIVAEKEIGIGSVFEPKLSMNMLTGADDPQANARLIAAAPDMLEALQKLKWVSIDKDNMEFKCETTCFVLDEIRAAIAKATGEK